MTMTNIDTFMALDMRTGTIQSASPLPEAHVPAWVLDIDFGPEIGTLRTSARITDHYDATDLIDRQVIAVINLGERQIGSIISQCLVLGIPDADGKVVLIQPDRRTADGLRLS
ncbi:MAG: tRNA-binding protein [Phycisphaerae bacterium]|nr:tRNA-binding protein [Phycisphaerae bacterium]